MTAPSHEQRSQREELKDWLRFIHAESHILVDRPNLMFQLAANGPDTSKRA